MQPTGNVHLVSDCGLIHIEGNGILPPLVTPIAEVEEICVVHLKVETLLMTQMGVKQYKSYSKESGVIVGMSICKPL